MSAAPNAAAYGTYYTRSQRQWNRLMMGPGVPPGQQPGQAGQEPEKKRKFRIRTLGAGAADFTIRTAAANADAEGANSAACF